MTWGSFIASIVGGVLRVILPAYFAKKYGHAKAVAESSREQASVAKEQNRIIRNRLAESDGDFIDRLRSQGD